MKPSIDEARRLGIFGSPSFVADGEPFWGDDRLEDALAWRARGKLRAPPARDSPGQGCLVSV